MAQPLPHRQGSSGLGDAEELHLQQLAAAGDAAQAQEARQAVKHDLEAHFQSAGQQEEGEWGRAEGASN